MTVIPACEVSPRDSEAAVLTGQKSGAVAPVYLWVRLVRIAPGGRSPAAASVRLAPLPWRGEDQRPHDGWRCRPLATFTPLAQDVPCSEFVPEAVEVLATVEDLAVSVHLRPGPLARLPVEAGGGSSAREPTLRR
jgi:hypothetical protein